MGADLLRVRGATAVASTLLVVAMPTSLRPTTTRKTMAPSIATTTDGTAMMTIRRSATQRSLAAGLLFQCRQRSTQSSPRPSRHRYWQPHQREVLDGIRE